MSALILILARADNGVIGNAGGIPWRIADDLRRFKALTMGKPVVFGRKTWESLPKKPLPGRTNIVVTRDKYYVAPGAMIAHSLDEAIMLADRDRRDEVMIAGGVELYRAALPLASRIELTEVHGEYSGDVRLPEFDASVWRETARSENATKDGLRYSYVTLQRA